MNIGFIGLGNMGFYMAGNIVKHGHTVYAYDISKENLDRLCEKGAVGTGSAAEVAKNTEITVFMLPESHNTAEAVMGEGGFIHGCRPGQIVIDMCSGVQSVTVKLAEELNKLGVGFIDAPVSGSAAMLANGELSIMASGPKEIYEQCVPVLQCMGKTLFHCSEEVGIGHAIKAINNMLWGVNCAALCEALVLAKKAGIEPRLLLDVVNSSSGMSYASKVKAPVFILNRKFGPNDGGFKSRLQHKDLNIATTMAKELGTLTPLANLAQQYYAAMMCKGLGNVDLTGVLLLLEDMAGVTIEG